MDNSVLSPDCSPSLPSRQTLSMNLKLTNSIGLTGQSDMEILLFTTPPLHTKARIIVMHYPEF